MVLNFVNRNDIKNVGDYWSSPLHYYRDRLIEVGHSALHYDIKKFAKKHTRNQDPLILGGGGLLGNSVFTSRLEAIGKGNSEFKVIWSAGDHSLEENIKFLINQCNQFDLYGIRDYISGYEEYWVPCVSCMHPLFDKYKNSSADVEAVYFLHKDKPLPDNVLEKFPGEVLTNETNDLDKVLSFLSRAEYIFTNSYHGVYWSQLLGKKVITNPWNIKFQLMKYKPVFAEYDNWYTLMHSATKYDILDECRERNNKFFNKIMDRI